MSLLGLSQIISASAGIITGVIVCIFRRFGPGSWLLALFLLPASLYSGVLALAPAGGALPEETVRLSLVLLLVSAPLGVVVSYTINRKDYYRYLQRRRFYIGLMILSAAIFIAALYVLPKQAAESGAMSPGAFSFGPMGYLAAIYLFLLSVVVLANLEQTLRSAKEHVRWEIKFLLLGLAGVFGAIVYISSKVLLFPVRLGVVSSASLQILPLLLLACCGLTLVSWKRSSGHAHVVVSQGVVYSSITLLSVGLYLIVSSLVTRWAGQLRNTSVPVEAVLFLLSLVALGTVLLSTDFRHHAKRWIRRHLLAGRYDYRHYWLQSSQRAQSTDPPETVAEALVDMVQNAVGAINVSVWMRLQNPTRLKLLAAAGNISDSLSAEAHGVVEKFYDITWPVPADQFSNGASDEPTRFFLEQTQAALIIPLLSGHRVTGLLTVGNDRSGQPYDWEALEFLGVLARHAAGELHKMELLATLVQAKETEAFRTFSTFLLHDLKNFASTLSLIAKNASRHQNNPQFQRDAFQSVYETSERMKKLCNSLKTLSTTLASHKKVHNLNQIARSVADTYSMEPGVRLKLDLWEVPPILVDGEEIASVLQNLILNAREAIAPEGTITVRTRNFDGTVELSVEDNGKGMAPEFMERKLFLPFHTTKSDGLGIGLFQSKKIIEAHDGAIQVESFMGKGTIVRVLLPAAQEVMAAAAESGG